MNNRLYMSRAYLAGPIDRVPDRGVQWRQDLTVFLRSLNIGVIDPCNKPILNSNPEDNDFVLQRQQLKSNGDYKLLHSIMAEVVSTDLRSIDLSDFIILHIDTSVHMCGSYNEQTYASLERKPVIIHCPTGVNDVPDWLYGVCDYNEMFKSWADLKAYLTQIAYFHLPTSKRWKFMDYKKIYGM